jgi:predicted secreted protein
MNKKLKKTLTVLGFITTVLIVKFAIDNYNYYELGERDTFLLNIGERLTIKIRENGSTGYQNCWVNEVDCKHLKINNRDYKSSFHESIGYIGAGGTAYLTFIGTSIGTDTIKISIIPSGDTCSCKGNPSNQSKNFNPQTGYQFIVNVKQ